MTTPLDYWINFALYAVAGKLGHADYLLQTRRAEVLAGSTELRAALPIAPVRLYRGLLLPEPCERIAHDTDFTFVSWTEDPDVAEWFADPASVISSHLRHLKPTGVVAERDLDPARVLFHHSWRCVPGLGDLAVLALAHPHVRDVAEQVHWSLSTQREVILLPDEQYQLRLPPASRTRELNARLAPPWMAP